MWDNVKALILLAHDFHFKAFYIQGSVKRSGRVSPSVVVPSFLEPMSGRDSRNSGSFCVASEQKQLKYASTK